MMWSQLKNEIGSGYQRDHAYARYSNPLPDLRRRLRTWIRSARPALTQASCEALDVFALRRGITLQHVRARPPRVLDYV